MLNYIFNIKKICMENIDSWELKFQPCEYSDKLLNLITELNKMAKVPVNILEIKKACYYAREYHGDQKRKSGESYYSHPLIVAYLFAEYVSENAKQYYTTDLIIIAILHDTIEDTKLTKDMISKIFNNVIANGVQDLTRIKDGIKHTASKTLDLLYAQDKIDLLYVKLFDRSHNIKTIEFMPLPKKTKIIKETIIYFLMLAKKFSLNNIFSEIEKPYERTLSPFSIVTNSDEISFLTPVFSLSNFIK